MLSSKIFKRTSKNNGFLSGIEHRNSTRHKLIAFFLFVAFICLFVSIAPSVSCALKPTPTPIVVMASPTPDIEKRLALIEQKQDVTTKALEANIDYSKFLIQVIATIIAALVAIQGLANAFQMRRERQRFDLLLEREGSRELADRTGVEQVQKIMGVVERTLQSRLTAEELARQEANQARADLKGILDEFEDLKLFLDTFQENIDNAREDLVKSANAFAMRPRHDFRTITKELIAFAGQYDRYDSELKKLDKSGKGVTAQVSYIRGIAAHYANKPEVAKKYLTEVVGLKDPETFETEIGFKRRKANAYYYLGVIELNYANHSDAVPFFEEAVKLDPEGKDVLTILVTAEAYVQHRNSERAVELVNEAKERLRRHERSGSWNFFYEKLRSRAGLIEVNAAIVGRNHNWPIMAIKTLEVVREKDPTNYFAVATLAQTYAVLHSDLQAKFFREAYENIQSSGDLFMVNEIRSKILLLMTAGMCCKHGLNDEKKSEKFFDQANELRNDLPIGCTVFSILTKLNESSEEISAQIKRLRIGEIIDQWSSDQFFTIAQQKQLSELMLRWRAARDAGQAFPAEDQKRLEELVEAELVASAKRAEKLALEKKK